MAQVLRQSTAVDVLIGPFVDSTDGFTSEEGLSPAVELSKNGQALAAKNDATTPVVDDLGYYNCELDATDTNTVGTLVLAVEGSATHLPVRHEFQVIEEAIYDAFYAGSATGLLPANVTQIAGAAVNTSSAQLGVNVVNAAATAWGSGAITAASIASNAITSTKIAANAIGASELAADAVTEIQSGLATSSALATAQTDLDTITGSDGVTLATTQGNYAPSKAGDAMDLVTGAVDANAVAADAVDEIWDEVMAGTTTARELLRGFAAALLGKASGLDTTTAVYRDIADTMNVISATVDANGNRSAVTLDLDDTP